MSTIGNTNISTSVVGDAIGVSSHALSELCTSEKINKWSRWKPVRSSLITMTEDGLAAANFGLSIPDGSTDPITAAKQDYEYLKPTGTQESPYRLGDFRNYDHIAEPVFSDGITSYTVDKRTDTSFTFMCDLKTAPKEGEFAYSELLPELADCYLCFVIQYGSTWCLKTANITLKESESATIDYPTWNLKTEAPFIYDYTYLTFYWCLSKVKHTGLTASTNLNQGDFFYPIPSKSKRGITGNIYVINPVTTVDFSFTGISQYITAGYLDITHYYVDYGSEYFPVSENNYDMFVVVTIETHDLEYSFQRNEFEFIIEGTYNKNTMIADKLVKIENGSIVNTGDYEVQTIPTNTVVQYGFMLPQFARDIIRYQPPETVTIQMHQIGKPVGDNVAETERMYITIGEI